MQGIEEKLLGGNLKFMLGTGSFIGLTGYEARYNRGFRADVQTLVNRTDLLEARDSEIFAGYTSVFEDPTSGEVWLDGQRWSKRNPYEAVRRGIAFVPEERRSQAVGTSQVADAIIEKLK